MNKFLLSNKLPEKTKFLESVRRAPSRNYNLSSEETKLSLKNALRYIPKILHEELLLEFKDELLQYGRVYGYRYRPGNGENNIKARPIKDYDGILEAKAIQLMMDNNVSFEIALFPYELVTYGSNGQVCQNWMQFILIKKMLMNMREDQTIVVMSGHPLGIFNTQRNAPRVINTNAMMVGLYDNPDAFHKAAAMGVANYGQMTAGGWMYIGPQGIVHGTYITLLNAGRKFLNIPNNENLKGKIFISSGLGGMSGAQAKAIEIAGGIGIIAEVDISRILTRVKQNWVSKMSSNLDEIFSWVEESKVSLKPISIAYHGNIIDLWEYVLKNNIHVDLGSDQTSCHDPYGGGYTPKGMNYENAMILLTERPDEFRNKVNKTLKLHFEIISKLVKKGLYFFDYGNSFLKAVYDAGEKKVLKNGKDTYDGFIYPSYVEDIMGPICFDFGYGPFRWVCLSGDENDLKITDRAAMELIDPNRNGQDSDNYNWIKNANTNNLVVGSKARILYADNMGRVNIALKFNQLVRNGIIGPIMLGRDHHDTGGTDSPFRETANIKDGSNIMADMSIQSWGGNILRGMTFAVLSNGGGVGIGKSVNGGFGLVLDGSQRVDEIIKNAIDWDVMISVGRRSWARNNNAMLTTKEWNELQDNNSEILLPFSVDDELFEDIN